MLAVGVVAVMVASFAGFFADLYQIAVADRDSVRKHNEQLLKEISVAREEVRTSAMALAAENALRPIAPGTIVVTEENLVGAVILTRWGPNLEEAHSVMLTDIKDGLPGRGKLLGHESQLGPDKPTSTLGLYGGVEWSGNWSLDVRTLRLTELRPRFNDGVSTEIDLRTWNPGHTVPAKRMRGSSVESGIAEVSLRARQR